MENSRSDPTFTNLAAFSKEIYVCCPHCEKKAVIISSFGKYSVPYPYKAQSKFNCSNCFYAIDDEKWYGPVWVFPKYNRCANCGSELETVKERVAAPIATMLATCNVCGQEHEYEADYHLAHADESQGIDPYFGLQLWLQATLGNHLVWAYNLAHLDYLKQYINAKLRMRVQGGNRSMVSKLPSFLTTAKNRPKVLKIIERLIIKMKS